MEIFDEDICLLDEAGKYFLAVGSGGVEGQGFLVGIELQEVVARFVGKELEFVTGSIAAAGTFDFDDVGAEPEVEYRKGPTAQL